MISDQVKRWSTIIKEEISRKHLPFPVELILSLMQLESSGVAGAVNKKSGASGLLQVMPGTLDWYNQKTGSKITLKVLRENTTTAGRIQIRVGLWVLGQYWKSSYKWLRERLDTVPVEELVRWADAYYAAGPGRIQKMAGTNRTWSVWKDTYPESTITRHVENVWSSTTAQSPKWDLDAIDAWCENHDKKKQINGLIVALTIISIGFLVMKFLAKQGNKKWIESQN